MIFLKCFVAVVVFFALLLLFWFLKDKKADIKKKPQFLKKIKDMRFESIRISYTYLTEGDLDRLISEAEEASKIKSIFTSVSELERIYLILKRKLDNPNFYFKKRLYDPLSREPLGKPHSKLTFIHSKIGLVTLHVNLESRETFLSSGRKAFPWKKDDIFLRTYVVVYESLGKIEEMDSFDFRKIFRDEEGFLKEDFYPLIEHSSQSGDIHLYEVKNK